MRRLLLIIIFLILLSCRGDTELDQSYYSIEVKINPSAQYISSSVNLHYLHPHDPVDSISFLLHENLIVESVKCEGLKSFVFDTVGSSPIRFIPEAGVLKIKLRELIQRNQLFELQIKYAGNINIVSAWETNRITEDWVELSNYTPWFPYNKDLEKISYKIKLVINPDYDVVGNGVVKKADDHWLIENKSGCDDIIIAASKRLIFEEINKENYYLKLFSAVEISKEVIDSILEASSRIFENYNEWFGPSDSPEATVLITPRERGGGYARKGLIVLSKITDQDYFDNKYGYIRYFSHEFAHFWWSNALSDSWEDWLNESFAEYSAMLLLRDIAGKNEFNKRIKKKSENFSSLPPIRELDRNDERAYEVLYNKGCYILYNLEKDLGNVNFMNLMRLVYSKKVSITDEFIKLISDKYGEELAQKYNSMLDT
ncbi:M1 family aminopeptidase [Bacteroidota bacterium]